MVLLWYNFDKLSRAKAISCLSYSSAGNLLLSPGRHAYIKLVKYAIRSSSSGALNSMAIQKAYSMKKRLKFSLSTYLDADMKCLNLANNF